MTAPKKGTQVKPPREGAPVQRAAYNPDAPPPEDPRGPQAPAPTEQMAPRVPAAEAESLAPAPSAQSTSPLASAIDEGMFVAPTVTMDQPSELEAHEISLAADIERIRKMGRVTGGLRQKLALPPISGYFQHWFNDTAGRIAQAEAAGFSFVNDQKTGKPITMVVGTGRDGKPLNAYAMKLPEVFHEEDKAARHRAAQSRVDAVRESPFRARQGEAKKSDQGKFYSPVEGQDPISVAKG